jgi:hypothetical protein
MREAYVAMRMQDRGKAKSRYEIANVRQRDDWNSVIELRGLDRPLRNQLQMLTQFLI